MKDKVIAICFAAGMLGAINSQAAYVVVTGAADSTPTVGGPGQSGVSVFTVTFENTLGGSANWTSTTLKQYYTSTTAAVFGLDLNVSNPTASQSHYQVLTDAGVGNYDTYSSITVDKADSSLILGTGQTYQENVPYTVVVDWTLNPLDTSADTPSGIYLDFAVLDPSGSYDEVETQAQVVVATPEPGQTVAGAMLLGCGLIGFTGRRWLKKHAADSAKA